MKPLLNIGGHVNPLLWLEIFPLFNDLTFLGRSNRMLIEIEKSDKS